MKEQRGLRQCIRQNDAGEGQKHLSANTTLHWQVFICWINTLYRTPQPDYIKIKEITEAMTGALLDRPYIENISDYIDQLEKVTVGNLLLTLVTQ